MVMSGARFGHRVEPGGAERAASQQAASGQPQATAGAVHLERLEGIAGTGGVEPAGGGSTLPRHLVDGDQTNTRALDHRRLSIRSSIVLIMVANSSCVRRVAIGRAPIRYSPGPMRSAAAASSGRRRRRIRLRSTAEPKARPMANATRGGPRSGSRTTLHHRAPTSTRRPSTRRRSNDARSRIAQIRPTACGGRERGAPSGSTARRGCSSGGGTRASWRDGGCSAGRCASPGRLLEDLVFTNISSPPARGVWLGAAGSQGQQLLADLDASGRGPHDRTNRPGQLGRLRPSWGRRQLLPARTGGDGSDGLQNSTSLPVDKPRKGRGSVARSERCRCCPQPVDDAVDHARVTTRRCW